MCILMIVHRDILYIYNYIYVYIYIYTYMYDTLIFMMPFCVCGMFKMNIHIYIY